MATSRFRAFLDDIIDNPNDATTEADAEEVFANAKAYRKGSQSLQDREDNHLSEWISCHRALRKLDRGPSEAAVKSILFESGIEEIVKSAAR